MENENTNAALTVETATPYFKQLGESGGAVLYKICAPAASPADIAAALGQKLDKDGKPRSTDIRISGISQLIQAGFIVTAKIPEGGLKPVTVKRQAVTSAAIAAAKAEAEAAALATVTAAALAVLNATNGNAAALAGMPEDAVSAALEQYAAAEAEKRNAANAEAAATLAECAAAAGVEAADLLDWITARATAEAVKTDTKKTKKA